MTHNDHPTRRRVLQTSAGVLALVTAGCLGAQTSVSNPDAAEPSEAGGPEASDSHGGSPTDHHAGDGHHEHSPTAHEGGHDHAHGEEVPAPADSVTFRMTTSDAGHHFEPHVQRLTVGGTATWVNESGTHTATAYHPDNDRPRLVPEGAEPFDSGLLTAEGAEFSHTFETEGVYHFYCVPHESVGMLGSVIVGEPDPHDQPALGEVPTSLPDGAQRKLDHLNEKCNEALGHTH